jgi:hypothetical protein
MLLWPVYAGCVESLGELRNALGWLAGARGEINPPLTEAEKKEVHDYVMHFANATRPDYAPMFTEKDYEP